MAPGEDRIRVSARITKELDARIRQHYASAAQAINEALELLVGTKGGTVTPDGIFGTNSDAMKSSTEARNPNIGASNDADGNSRDPNGTTELKSRLTDAMAQVEFLKRADRDKRYPNCN